MANNEQQRAYAEYMGTLNHGGRQYYYPQGAGEGLDNNQPQVQPQSQSQGLGQTQTGPYSYNFAQLSLDQLRHLSPNPQLSQNFAPPAPTPPSAVTQPATTHLDCQNLGIPPPSAAIGNVNPAFGAFGAANSAMPPPPQMQGFGGMPQMHGFGGMPPMPPGMQGNPPPGGQASAYGARWQYNHAEAGGLQGGPPPSMCARQGQHPTTTRDRPPQPTSPYRSSYGGKTKSKLMETHYYDEHGYLRPKSPDSIRRMRGMRGGGEEAAHAVPVLFCHTCSECGRLRSAGFHREHPVIPGQPLIEDVCRRCRKKGRGHDETVRRSTRIRKCIADEPCDWPDTDIPITAYPYVQVESRGRARSRSVSSSDVYVSRRRSRSYERVPKIIRAESRNRMGLGVLQDRRLPRLLKRKSKSIIRLASLSPPRETVTSSKVVYRSVSQSPPPYRELRDRIPSPARETTRVLYRGVRTPSPIRRRATSPSMILRDMPRGPTRGAEDRMAAHPRAYRPMIAPSSPPPPGILKNIDMVHETAHRRRAMERRSMESTMVDVGGPRVQFASSRPAGLARLSSESEHMLNQTKRHAIEEVASGGDDFDFYKQHTTYRYNERSPSPPVRRLEELRVYEVEKSPISPIRQFEEVRVRHASPVRGRSPPPVSPLSSPSHQFEEVHVRYMSPARGRSPRRASTPHAHPQSPSAEHETVRYRSVTRQPVELEYTPSPPPTPQFQSRDWEEVTATESEQSGDVVNVRKWRGLDENGQPATFVEERKTVFFPERGREKEREPARAGSWRDI